jgi:hypothetical protein
MLHPQEFPIVELPKPCCTFFMRDERRCHYGGLQARRGWLGAGRHSLGTAPGRAGRFRRHVWRSPLRSLPVQPATCSSSRPLRPPTEQPSPRLRQQRVQSLVPRRPCAPSRQEPVAACGRSFRARTKPRPFPSGLLIRLCALCTKHDDRTGERPSPCLSATNAAGE